MKRLIILLGLGLFIIACGSGGEPSDGDVDPDVESETIDTDLEGDSEVIALDGDAEQDIDEDIDEDIELSDTLCEEFLNSLPRIGDPCPYANDGNGSLALCTGEAYGGCMGAYIICADGFWRSDRIYDAGCEVLINTFELCCDCDQGTEVCEGG